jgi:hypothetical protein
MYELDGQPVRAALGAGAAIDPPYRNKSLMLIGKSLRDKSVDVTLVGSANSAVSQLLNVIAKRIPSPDSDVPMLWPVNYRKFAGAALRRKNITGAPVLAFPCGVGLQIADLFRRKRFSTQLRMGVADAFDDSFDAFWERIRTSSSRLRAVRTRANLEWRFRTLARKGRLKVVTARSSGNTLEAYMVLTRSDRSEFGFRVLEVGDVQVIDDNPDVIGVLLQEALAVASSDGSGMLKFRGWNAGKRMAAERLRPYSYRYPLWQAYYNVANSNLAAPLTSADAWDFSPFEIY